MSADTTVVDTIERVLDFSQPIERVWSAISDPVEIAQWFGDKAEFEQVEGGEGAWSWESNSQRMKVVAIEPPRRFAWRWVVVDDSDKSIPLDEKPTTLVEFTLESTDAGTRLTMIESGFASLPADVRAQCLTDNTGGWTSELGDLVAYLSA